MGRRLRHAGVLLAICLSLVWASPSSAHTELLQGSPGPAQQAGGTVDFVDLAFFEPVSDVVIEIEGPDGQLLDGAMVVADGQIIRYEMPALTDVGRYILRYTMTSADGDFTESTYFFEFDPAALQPTRLGEADVPNNRSRNIAVAAGFVFVACLIGALLIGLSSLERRRAESTEGVAADEDKADGNDEPGDDWEGDTSDLSDTAEVASSDVSSPSDTS